MSTNLNLMGVGGDKTNKEGAAANAAVSSPTPKNETTTDVVNDKVEEVEEPKGPYTDKRSITVCRIANYSLYRKINDKVLDERRDFIGSSITSANILSSNEAECAAYFPKILGIGAKHDTFVERVRVYLNNICIPVNALGKTFDTSFRYNSYADYKRIKTEEDRIEAIYEKAPKTNTFELKKALTERIDAINELEGTKYLYGSPVNVADYIIYRHCLVYRDVCKDIALADSDRNVRFYIKDEDREKERQLKFHNQIKTAKRNYLTIVDDVKRSKDMYVQYLIAKGLPIGNVNEIDTFEIESKLDEFSRTEPAKFNKMYNDKNLSIRSAIETLIARGEFIRSTHNQQISTVDGDYIGANMKEAIAYFNNPANATICNTFIQKLKL